MLEKRTEELLSPKPIRERYEFILDNLKDLYPFLTTYFSRMHRGNGLHCVAISTKGQRAIVSQISGNPQIVVCDNYERFDVHLRNFYSSNTQQQTYALRHRTSENLKTNHTTAIHAVKGASEITFFFADSTGGPNSWSRLIIAAIKRAHHESGCILQQTIYLYAGKSRQVDHTNCVVYALRDAAYMAKSSEELMSWVLTQGQPQQLEEHVFGVSFMPLHFMKTTQSLRAINNYLVATEQKTVKAPSKKNIEGETLEESLSRHLYIAIDDSNARLTRNGKVSKMFLKFERNIIHQAILDQR